MGQQNNGQQTTDNGQSGMQHVDNLMQQSEADSVWRLLIELLSAYHGRPCHGLFQTDIVQRFFKRLPGTDRCLGFDMPAAENSSSVTYFSVNTVGHLGFTGTSFWMDLDRSIIVVLLTNRVHPARDNEAIKAFRPTLHDEVMRCLLQNFEDQRLENDK